MSMGEGRFVPQRCQPAFDLCLHRLLLCAYSDGNQYLRSNDGICLTRIVSCVEGGVSLGAKHVSAWLHAWRKWYSVQGFFWFFLERLMTWSRWCGHWPVSSHSVHSTSRSTCSTGAMQGCFLFFFFFPTTQCEKALNWSLRKFASDSLVYIHTCTCLISIYFRHFLQRHLKRRYFWYCVRWRRCHSLESFRKERRDDVCMATAYCLYRLKQVLSVLSLKKKKKRGDGKCNVGFSAAKAKILSCALSDRRRGSDPSSSPLIITVFFYAFLWRGRRVWWSDRARRSPGVDLISIWVVSLSTVKLWGRCFTTYLRPTSHVI